MPEFRYKALDQSGYVRSRSVTAETYGAALDALKAEGLTPFELAEGAEGETVPWWAREYTIGRAKVPTAEIAQFLSGFALLLNAKLPLTLALEAAVEDIPHARLKSTIVTAMRDVQAGQSLALSLERHDAVIPPRIVALIRLGEDANRLADTVSHAAELMQRELSFRSDLRSALTYPAILLLASCAVVAALIFLLAPTLMPVFTATQAEPPAVIVLMLGIRELLVDDWPVILAVSLTLALTARTLLKRDAELYEELLLTAPLIGPLLRLSAASQPIMTLTLLLKSGATVLTALEAAKETSRWSCIRKLFADAEEDVRSGAPLARVLGNNKLLPRPVPQMIRLGEQADQLEDMLLNASQIIDTQLRHQTQRLTQLLTPTLTLLIGLIVGLIVFSTLSAILEINELAF